MRLKSENIARINNDLTKIEMEREEAQEKHHQALKKQREREIVLNSYSVRKWLGVAFSSSIIDIDTEVAKFGLVAAYPLAGALVGAGVSAWLSASAAKTVATAEAALAEKRQAARNLDHVMKSIEIDLGKFQSEKGGLVSQQMYLVEIC